MHRKTSRWCTRVERETRCILNPPVAVIVNRVYQCVFYSTVCRACAYNIKKAYFAQWFECYTRVYRSCLKARTQPIGQKVQNSRRRVDNRSCTFAVQEEYTIEARIALWFIQLVWLH
jgi:hypothetical protein